MKNYITPELKALAFVAEEAISNAYGGNLEGSSLTNDADGSKMEWGDPLN